MALEASEGLRMGAISGNSMGVIRNYPVDCRLIEVASSGMLTGDGGRVKDGGWEKTYPSYASSG